MQHLDSSCKSSSLASARAKPPVAQLVPVYASVHLEDMEIQDIGGHGNLSQSNLARYISGLQESFEKLGLTRSITLNPPNTTPGHVCHVSLTGIVYILSLIHI